MPKEPTKRVQSQDVDVLGAWKHEESLDGLANYLFWGRDAEQIATAVEAPRVEEKDPLIDSRGHEMRWVRRERPVRAM